MEQKTSFDPSWINKVIDFEASDTFPLKQWKIVDKLNEISVQNDEEDDGEESGHAHMQAIAIFECVNHMDACESAFMKIYMQIPYTGSDNSQPEDRAQQALPKAEITEEMALLALTKQGCKSISPVFNWKREEQDESGPVPGGYLVYLVVADLPGVRISRDDYWNLSRKQRDEVRDAFKVAYTDCLSCGIIRTSGVLGTSLIWDKASKKMFIVGFRYSRAATEKDVWGSHLWLAWGFGERRREVSNMPQPLPSDILEDGSINEALWEL
ncbi:uncharacterized protein TRUGW13939_05356 [Talaromyces rugulosus]|uniref:Uncharacterized protein n=1 Tax=Talaromyces rugulosus TaxID=121627 RepID=A0A7H8QXQ5_TALRU|nr:uncharacterized protein TRUGW13939_05356 [Talaromyces rugulosus]QKX58235.1 hypothetical protein TRUGW13939_05356 [Talaromyces rugulosus]